MTEKKDGLLRIPLCMDSKNPKDPPQALLDTGANCNLISSDYASHNFDKDIIENSMPTRRIKFANKSRSETCKQLNLNFDIDQNGVIKCFNAEFLVCPDLCENVILGRPFLDSSGLTHLCITSSTAPNPFEPSINQIVIEHLDDKDGEGEDAIEPDQDLVSFDVDTSDIWIDFAAQFQLTPTEFFNAIAWAATNTKIKISEILDNMEEIKNWQVILQVHRSNLQILKSVGNLIGMLHSKR